MGRRRTTPIDLELLREVCREVCVYEVYLVESTPKHLVPGLLLVTGIHDPHLTLRL